MAHGYIREVWHKLLPPAVDPVKMDPFRKWRF